MAALPAIATTRWWAKRLGLSDGPLPQARGQGIRVAVVDTGVRPHPDLKIADGRNLTTDGGPADYRDRDGHGSHVAGIIAGAGALIGVAPDTEIYAARLPGGGQGRQCRRRRGNRDGRHDCLGDIINMSLGGRTTR